MPPHHADLPQLRDDVVLADGGIETTLIFHDGLDLPDFAAFTLLDDEPGRRALERYFESYLDVARDHSVGLVLETPTWRASRDWGEKLGFDAASLRRVNEQAVQMVASLREGFEGPQTPLVASGCVGPQGDGYRPATYLSAAEAAEYHAAQADSFAAAGADVVTAITMTYAEEAVGVAEAARRAGLPAVLSFTVETDGRLPNGQPLGEAVEQVDSETGGYPAYFMVNCAHPAHFADVLDAGAPWTRRIRGIRANASTASHDELDEAEMLDEGDPADLARRYAELRGRVPWLTVLGGCCGTDARHIRAIAEAVTP